MKIYVNVGHRMRSGVISSEKRDAARVLYKRLGESCDQAIGRILDVSDYMKRREREKGRDIRQKFILFLSCPLFYCQFLSELS
jgi:hypothetical protein